MYGYDKDLRPILIREPKLVLDNLDAGKIENFWLMYGRRPYAAFGNSSGDDQQMLRAVRAVNHENGTAVRGARGIPLPGRDRARTRPRPKFCYVENVVQANLLAATANNPRAINQLHNVAVGEQTTLNELYAELHRFLGRIYPNVRKSERVYRHFHIDEVRSSWADIGKARRLLSYAPTHRLSHGIADSIPWYSGRLMTQLTTRLRS
jgi:nucleoside-diphosphate-sugar epimerase